ncbi:MAG: hypothetical protein BACD_00168 [Bacteroides rodentium]
MSMVSGNIRSNKGFYIGDICYVLGYRIYHGIWGSRYGFGEGVIEVEDRTGKDGVPLCFAVARTSYGDGLYCDDEGAEYPVDAANIGIVPLELVDKEDGLGLGMVVECCGEAVFQSEDGVFDIALPGRCVHIDTR